VKITVNIKNLSRKRLGTGIAGIAITAVAIWAMADVYIPRAINLGSWPSYSSQLAAKAAERDALNAQFIDHTERLQLPSSIEYRNKRAEGYCIAVTAMPNPSSDQEGLCEIVAESSVVSDELRALGRKDRGLKPEDKNLFASLGVVLGGLAGVGTAFGTGVVNIRRGSTNQNGYRQQPNKESAAV